MCFVVENLISGERHLVCAVRKSHMCRCGCRGWCTLYPIFCNLRWSFLALARGTFPDNRDDREQWAPNDSLRASLAGLPMALRGALLQVRGDWAEFAHSLGFPTWQTNEGPCLWCDADKVSMLGGALASSVDFPYRLNTMADFEAACRRCEIHVVIRTAAQHMAIRAALVYDKRAHGNRGRCLMSAFPEFGLEVGDRLEPSREVPDVALFDAQSTFPLATTFWRASRETKTRHRNPLFDDALGVGYDTLCVDPLHCLFLGAFQEFAAAFLWVLFDANVWGPADGASGEQAIQLALLRLRSDLKAWISAKRRENPHRGLTEICDMTRKMVGARAEPKLALKGGETKTFVMFLCDLVLRFENDIPRGNVWRRALDAVAEHSAIMDDNPRRMTTPTLEAGMGRVCD